MAIIKTLINNMTMQKKMVLSFAIPIIIVYFLLNSICYHFITQKYEEQLRYSVKQSSTQTVSFMQNYIQNMQYLANLIEKSENIQSVLRDSEFKTSSLMDVQYREFYNLRNCLMELELSNPTYRLGIYVDTDKFYSQNNQFLFNESMLTERSDANRIMEYLDRNMCYLILTNERGRKSLTLLKRIYSTDLNKEPLNICSVSIDISNIVDLMANGNITKQGAVYLVDQNDQIVVTTSAEKQKWLSQSDNIPYRGSETNWKEVTIENENYFLIRKDVENVNWQMIFLIPQKEYLNQQLFIKVFQYIMVGTIMLLSFLTSIYLSKYYLGRLSNLKRKMDAIQTGNLNVQLPMQQKNGGDEIDEIFRKFNFMVGEIRRLMQEHYQLGKNVKISELKALQAQINPHFLYNTLDLINWMAMDYGASEIENIVYNLSRFYRLSLNKGKNVLTIREELEHVRVYVNIENIHFDHEIDFSIDIPEKILDKCCLNIILQPLVENAIVHGIAEVPEIDHMCISITADLEDNDVIFHVQDDGIGMSMEQICQLETKYMKENGKGYGVQNINFRLKLCYGEQYGITYDHTLEKGTRANVRIPLLDVEEVEKRLNG